jgi:uncharacterized membrane protein YphA (DoxX/SURF4 family)
MHNFWTLEDPQAKQVDQIMFMKNIAMIGGLLVLAWAMAGTEAPLTITNGVF